MMLYGKDNKKLYDIDFTVNNKEKPEHYSLKSIRQEDMHEIVMRMLWWPEGSIFKGTVLKDEEISGK